MLFALIGFFAGIIGGMGMGGGTILIPIAVFGVLGAVFGSLLANYLSSDILKKIFGIFLLLVGLFEVKKGFCAKSDKKPLN